MSKSKTPQTFASCKSAFYCKQNQCNISKSSSSSSSSVDNNSASNKSWSSERKRERRERKNWPLACRSIEVWHLKLK